MSNKPMKRTGFQQGVFAQSATQKEELGALRILRDGRKFRYAKAGASNLAAGKLAVGAAVAAQVMNEACTAVHPIGEVVFTETITAGVAFAENYFAGGYLQINDGTGEGHQYKIISSSAVTSSGTSITLMLDEPIRVATAGTSASEFSIIQSPWMATVESTTLGCPVGITPIVVTAAYFYWAQTCGPASALSGNTDAVGKPLYQSTTTAGALAGLDAASYYPQIAIALGTAGVAGEYKPVMLTLD
jgi:hypothetical protein